MKNVFSSTNPLAPISKDEDGKQFVDIYSLFIQNHKNNPPKIYDLVKLVNQNLNESKNPKHETKWGWALKKIKKGCDTFDVN